ncbi:MAG: hypothetical protein Q4D62_06855 [Planctomycetia bacterium]|nr:hypothetical protein [Planctomycetia bacterium]
MLQRGMLAMMVVSLLLAGCQTKTDAESAAEEVKIHQVDITPSPQYKPTLAMTLPDSCSVPDGMTLDDATGMIYLNVPNFAPRTADGKKVNPALLARFDKNDQLEILLEYPVHEGTGEVGPMGLDFGPDGNLYVCDNQFFVEPNGSHASRILRVEMKEGKPTGKVETVVDGLKLANAVLWKDGFMYVTDTNLQIPDRKDFGNGCIWRFAEKEVVGTTQALKVDPTVKEGVPVDSHMMVVCPVKKIGRGDNSGLDGLTWAWGALYVGNFGDGVMFRIDMDEAGKATATKVLDDESVHCCDGIFYDAATDKIYISDSQANAIRTLSKEHVPGWLWVNDDTNGEDGLLDQPAECLVRDGVLYVVNFDWAFPGLKNTTSVDKPYSISAITVGTQPDVPAKKAAEVAAEATVELPPVENE